MQLHVLKGSIRTNIVNGINYKIVSRIYCKGKLVTRHLTAKTLRPNTYLLTSVGVNRNMIEFSAYEVSRDDDGLVLCKVDLKDLYLLDNMHNALREVPNLLYMDL
jgi:hypothetical protein